MLSLFVVFGLLVLLLQVALYHWLIVRLAGLDVLVVLAVVVRLVLVVFAVVVQRC